MSQTTDDDVHKCPWCEAVRPLRGLSCHASKAHRKTPAELHATLFHDGLAPLCACGCGATVKWQHSRFATFASRGCNGFNDEARVRAVAARREKLASGELKQWNAGLTKETDPRVARMASKIAASIDGVEVSRRLAARSPDEKRLQRERISKARSGGRPWNVGLDKGTSSGLASAVAKNQAHALQRPGWASDPSLIENAASVRSDQLRLLDFGGYKNKRSSLMFECVDCGAKVKRSLHVLRYSPACPACAGTDTKPQLELYDFVKSLKNDAVLSDKTVIGPLELDVYVPSARVGFEYNGLYYHSERFRPRGYHQKKAAACSAAGLRLFQVYADDWEFRRPIVESMIKHRLGFSRRVNARACVARSLTAEEREVFFEGNHLDGDVRAAACFGLEFDGAVIAAMSLRRPFHAKWGDHAEVARFATALGVGVVGGLSKLTKHAIAWAKGAGYRGLLSYVDGRVGDGSGYVAAGYVKRGSTSPMFWWTDYRRRYNRFKFRADKKRGLTERAVAEEAGVARVYGCCNSVMTLELKS